MKAGYTSGSNLLYVIVPGDLADSLAGANYGGGLKFGLMREASGAPFSLTALVGYQITVTTAVIKTKWAVPNMEYTLGDFGGGLELSKSLGYNQAPYLFLGYHSYSHSLAPSSTYKLSRATQTNGTEITLGYVFALSDDFALDINASSISYSDNPFSLAAQTYATATYGIKLAVSF